MKKAVSKVVPVSTALHQTTEMAFGALPWCVSILRIFFSLYLKSKRPLVSCLTFHMQEKGMGQAGVPKKPARVPSHHNIHN